MIIDKFKKSILKTAIEHGKYGYDCSQIFRYESNFDIE